VILACNEIIVTTSLVSICSNFKPLHGMDSELTWHMCNEFTAMGIMPICGCWTCNANAHPNAKPNPEPNLNLILILLNRFHDTLDPGHFGPKTQVSGQFGTSAKVSHRYFGTVSHQCQSVCETLWHWYQTVSTSSKRFFALYKARQKKGLILSYWTGPLIGYTRIHCQELATILMYNKWLS